MNIIVENKDLCKSLKSAFAKVTSYKNLLEILTNENLTNEDIILKYCEELRKANDIFIEIQEQINDYIKKNFQELKNKDFTWEVKNFNTGSFIVTIA